MIVRHQSRGPLCSLKGWARPVPSAMCRNCEVSDSVPGLLFPNPHNDAAGPGLLGRLCQLARAGRALGTRLAGVPGPAAPRSCWSAARACGALAAAGLSPKPCESGKSLIACIRVTVSIGCDSDDNGHHQRFKSINPVGRVMVTVGPIRVGESESAAGPRAWLGLRRPGGHGGNLVPGVRGAAGVGLLAQCPSRAAAV